MGSDHSTAKGDEKVLRIRRILRRINPDALYETVCQNRLTM